MVLYSLSVLAFTERRCLVFSFGRCYKPDAKSQQDIVKSTTVLGKRNCLVFWKMLANSQEDISYSGVYCTLKGNMCNLL